MGLSTGKKILNTAQVKNYYTEQPAGLRWRSNKIFILTTVGVGLFTDLFLYGLVVPILPFMLRDRVGLPESQIQSHTSGLLAAYAGASVVFSPLAGILADKISTRQAPFLLGILALLGATIILFTAETVPVLVVARILQGISSAFVWTIGLALCLETVGPDNLGKAVGSIFSFVSVGAIWAPFLGGLLYEKAGYSGVLGIALAVLVIDFVLRLMVIEKKVARRYGLKDEDEESSEDTREDQQQHNDNDENDEADEQQPLLGGVPEDDERFKLPKEQGSITRTITILPCLKNPRLLTALWVALVQAALLGSFDATIPIVSQELFKFDSLKAGVLFLPLGLTDFICGPIAGWAVDRYGTKPVSVVTYLFLVPPVILLRLPHEGGTEQIVLYATLLALCGIGLSGTSSPSIVEAGAVVQRYYDVNPEFFGDNGPYAQLYGLNSMMFNVGLTIGPELAGELKQKIGYGNMNLVLAVICGLTAVLSFFFMGGKPKVMRRDGLARLSPYKKR